MGKRRLTVDNADVDISDGLRNFGQASPFRRVCLSMLAWSLSMEDRRRLRAKFLELDVQKKGAISLPEFKAALQQSYRINGPEAERLFATLDTNHDSEISYTELLAAAMDENARKDDSVLRRTFARFDRDEAGEITADDLRTLAGDTFDNAAIAEMMKDADTAGTGGITYK